MTDLNLKKRICRPVHNCKKFSTDKASCLNPIYFPTRIYVEMVLFFFTQDSSLYYNRKNSRCDVRDIQGRVVWYERYLGTRNKYARLG